MDIKDLQQGETVRIKETGQEVQIKQVSEHGFALVQFRTGGEYLLLNNRLEAISQDDTRH